MTSNLPGPDRMREAVAEYVAAVHRAYVRQGRLLTPAAQGRLPLMGAGRFHIAAVGVRNLHLIATAEPLGTGSRGEVVALDQEAPPLAWTLRFYDPVVLPALGLLDESAEPAFEEVRRILGIGTLLYHLTLRPPADLAEHHAGHTGAGLANAHAAVTRDFDAIRAAVRPGLVPLAAEFEGAGTAGLVRAAALIARELAPTDETVERLAAAAAGGSSVDAAELRRAVLHAVRGVRSAVASGGRE
jgi:hypothetical protein